MIDLLSQLLHNCVCNYLYSLCFSTQHLIICVNYNEWCAYVVLSLLNAELKFLLKSEVQAERETDRINTSG